jgi:hypothetical protein
MRQTCATIPGSSPRSIGHLALMASTILPNWPTMALVGRRMLSIYVKVVVFTVAWAFNALARGIHVLAQQMLLGRALMI